MLKNIWKHFILITKHRIRVFKFCIKAGIPWRGFVHDLSKYSPTEFWESAKYYTGKGSPITQCKKENGYSNAWLHHKGRNKHHHEYWYDYRAPIPAPVIPYKYAVEMICDGLAAGKTYTGKGWDPSMQLEYWKKEREKAIINEKTCNFLTAAFTEIAEKGLDKTLNKKRLKELYKKYCES